MGARTTSGEKEKERKYVRGADDKSSSNSKGDKKEHCARLCLGLGLRVCVCVCNPSTPAGGGTWYDV